MHAVREPAVRRSPGDRFAAAMRAIVGRLPFGLAGRVPPSVVGFLLLNSLTFGIDLALLGTLRGLAHWPLPAAVSLAYATAFAVNFALNRALNFRVHGALGRQLGGYVLAVALNYLLWILGLADLLAWAGVDYRLARVAAGACEAAYMYAALRWVVFRPRGDQAAERGSIEG